MEHTRNGNSFVPIQVLLVAGLMVMIPALKFPSRSSSLQDLPSASVLDAIRETNAEEAILLEIMSDYRTFLPEGERKLLPGIIIEMGAKYGYDPLFVAGLIETESSFNNQAVSSAGARGLMQIIPSTGQFLAADLGTEWKGTQTLHDPEANIELGLYYLRQLEDQFGSLEIALAAYNMGPGLLEQKMALGFRPRGIYSGRVNAAFKQFRQKAQAIRLRNGGLARL